MSRICVGILVSVLGAAPAWGQSIWSTPPAAVDTQAPPAKASTPPAAMTSFASIFRDLGHDVAHLPSRESAVILGLAAALGGATYHRDVEITASASANEPLDETLDAGAVLGSGWVQVGGAFTAYAIGRGTARAGLASTGSDLVRAQLLVGAITQGVKLAVDRTRPDGSRYSFPSGHTSSAFATAAVLERHYGWRVGLPAYAAAAYVGGSRLTENKHYLSDVIFGAALGMVCGRATTVGREPARMALSPLATRGGGGVEVTWLGRGTAGGP
jgi:membrane-associated phospholipid phosphatase